MSDNIPPIPDLPYSPGDKVFPSPSDDDLWVSVWRALAAEYPDRALSEHVRRAFEAVCDELEEYLSFGDFLRKVRLKWLWKRPPLPRGMAEYDFDA